MMRANCTESSTSSIDANDSFYDPIDEDWFYGTTKKQKTEKDEIKNNFNVKTKSCSNESLTHNYLLPYHKIHLQSKRDCLYEISLGDFETYNKQRFALEKLSKSAINFKNSRIFSYEVDGGLGGERRYLVTTLERFWHWYERQNNRHMYELITEESPCRLYFDLEFSKESNPDIDPQKVYGHFSTILQNLLKNVYQINVDIEKDLLVLDSSTESKYSAHVICHLRGGYLFPSNISMRPFIKDLVESLAVDPPFKIWNADRTKETVVVDTSVYSKNRNFRLFLSSKLGKKSVLRLAEYCEFYGKRKPLDMEIFFDSLCVPADYEKYPVLDLKETSDDCVSNKENQYCIEGKNRIGSGPSPYPYIDEFILMVLRKWSPSVYIREWKLITTGNGKLMSIVYYPSNCRYCFNIGRQHKSNGTYWTVNFEKREFYQKCFDPECCGISSNMFPLPSFISNNLEHDDSKNLLKSTFLSPSDDHPVFNHGITEVGQLFTQWDQLFEE